MCMCVHESMWVPGVRVHVCVCDRTYFMRQLLGIGTIMYTCIYCASQY